MSAPFFWVIAGTVLIGLEAFAVPGIGLLFAGIAALCTAFLVYIEVAASVYLQLAAFFGLTALWAVLLWKPLKRAYASKSSNYTDMVGTTCIIASTLLKKGEEGQAKWSGTIMGVRIAEESSRDEISNGEKAEIVRVEGNILVVL